MGFIYKITNDINGKMYVGKTDFSVEKRFKEHCGDSKRPREENKPLYRAMNKYGINHFHAEVVEEVPNDILGEREAYWINKLDTYHNGYNATLGGEGKPLIDYELAAQIYKEIEDVGLVAKIMGHDKSALSKELRAKGVKIRSAQEKNIEKLGKPILQYDKNTMEFIAEYPSIGVAARTVGEESWSRHITQVAQGKRKTAYGFIWKYAEK